MSGIRERIWNRACEATDADAELRAGDRALAGALLAHNIVMNGGVLHALQGMSPSERRDAAAGYRFFALTALAELFELQVPEDDLDDADDDGEDGAESELDRLEAELNQKYWATAADDQALWRAFEKKLAHEPGLFAPVR
jgi:hypothetical protein